MPSCLKTIAPVFDGGHYVGCLLSRGIKGWSAFDAESKELGTFPNDDRAYQAILAAARAGARP